MLTIGSLCLELPAGFEHRADTIVHLVKRELAGALAGLEGEHRLPRVDLALELDPALDDAECASRIAGTLLMNVRGVVQGDSAEQKGGRGW